MPNEQTREELEREELELRAIMDEVGCDEDRARFILALARGETQGDVVAVDNSAGITLRPIE